MAKQINNICWKEYHLWRAHVSEHRSYTTKKQFGLTKSYAVPLNFGTYKLTEYSLSCVRTRPILIITVTLIPFYKFSQNKRDRPRVSQYFLFNAVARIKFQLIKKNLLRLSQVYSESWKRCTIKDLKFAVE